MRDSFLLNNGIPISKYLGCHHHNQTGNQIFVPTAREKFKKPCQEGKTYIALTTLIRITQCLIDGDGWMDGFALLSGKPEFASY